MKAFALANFLSKTTLIRRERLKQLKEREAGYLTARVVVDTDGATIEQVVSQIALRVHEIETAAASGTVETVGAEGIEE